MLVENIAIIGLGSIGKCHLRLLRVLKPNISITVVRSGKGNVVPEEEMAKYESKSKYLFSLCRRKTYLISPNVFPSQRVLPFRPIGIMTRFDNVKVPCFKTDS